MRYFVGILLITFGFFCIWKTEAFIRAFGRSSWAEEKLGYGGTWTFYKIIGVLSIILGFIILFGFAYAILDWIFPF